MTVGLIIAILIAIGGVLSAAIYIWNAWQNKIDADYHFARY